MGVDLILAGIHAEENSLFQEKIVPVAVLKKHKKKKKDNAFDFCIIQFSQSYCLYLAIEVFTEMCKIQKEGKGHRKHFRSFGNVTERSNRRCKEDNYHFLVIFFFNLFISAFVDSMIGNSCLTIGYNWTRHNSQIHPVLSNFCFELSVLD